MDDAFWKRSTYQPDLSLQKMLSILINVFPRGFLVDSTSLVVDPPDSFISKIIIVTITTIFFMLSPSSLIDPQ